MALPQPDKPTVLDRVSRPGFPIVPVLVIVNGMVGTLCVTGAYIVRQWRLARQAEIEAAERIALMTRGKGRWPRIGG